MRTRLLLLTALVVALGASPAVPTAAWAQTPKPAEPQKGPARVSQTAEIAMEKGGVIKIEFFPEDAPKTVENFVSLIKKKFYDGLTFHRVESDPAFSLIQGGDPKGDGSGNPGYSIKLEISPKLIHWTGALAMARSQDPDSAGCQFYICRVAIPRLDGQYAVFGKVVKGLEVSEKIQKGDKIISIRLK